MTKTQKILEYHMTHPDAPQRDIAANLGFSRQLVSIVLKKRGLRAAPAEYEVNKPGPTCQYCGKEVTSMTYDKDARKMRRCRYHHKCAGEERRYRGECPICGRHFEKIGSQVNRDRNGHPTSGIVVCSDLCRYEAMSRDLYPRQRIGRPKQGSRTT